MVNQQKGVQQENAYSAVVGNDHNYVSHNKFLAIICIMIFTYILHELSHASHIHRPKAIHRYL